MTAINYQELKEQAEEIDCCQFMKRHSPLRKPKNVFYDDIDEAHKMPNDHLSKQKKIKLISKKYYQ